MVHPAGVEPAPEDKNLNLACLPIPPRVHFMKEVPFDCQKTLLLWRRRGDSNSCAGYPTYALSRGASSPT